MAPRSLPARSESAGIEVGVSHPPHPPAAAVAMGTVTPTSPRSQEGPSASWDLALGRSDSEVANAKERRGQDAGGQGEGMGPASSGRTRELRTGPGPRPSVQKRRASPGNLGARGLSSARAGSVENARGNRGGRTDRGQGRGQRTGLG